jgi:hypothetical protein
MLAEVYRTRIPARFPILILFKALLTDCAGITLRLAELNLSTKIKEMHGLKSGSTRGIM